MAALANFSRFSRLNRICAARAAAASSGMALVSGRLGDAGIDREDAIVLPLPMAAAAEALDMFDRFDAIDWNNYPSAWRTKKNAFFERLARHVDARCRRAAAAQAELEETTLLALASDEAHDVRKQLADNCDAVRRLDSALLCEIAAHDERLIESLAASLERITSEAQDDWLKAAAAGDAALLVEKAKALEACMRAAQAFKNAHETHPDPNVRERLMSALDFPTSARMNFLHMSGRIGTKPKEERWRFVEPDGCVYALAFMREACSEAGDGSGTDMLDAIDFGTNAPMVFLEVRQLGRFLRMVQALKVSDEFLVRFAASGCAELREAVADRKNLPQPVLDLLKRDASYDVRTALLGNDDALALLDETDVIEVLAGDPLLLREAFEYASPSGRIKRVLHKAFDDSDDPGAREILAALDAED